MANGERDLRDIFRERVESGEAEIQRLKNLDFAESPQGQFFSDFLGRFPEAMQQPVPPQFGSGTGGFLGALGAAAQGPQAVGRFGTAVQRSQQERRVVTGENLAAQRDNLLTKSKLEAKRAELQAQFEEDRKTKIREEQDAIAASKVESAKSSIREGDKASAEARQQQQLDRELQKETREKQARFRHDLDEEFGADMTLVIEDILDGKDYMISDVDPATNLPTGTKTMVPGITDTEESLDAALAAINHIANQRFRGRLTDDDLSDVYTQYMSAVELNIMDRAIAKFKDNTLNSEGSGRTPVLPQARRSLAGSQREIQVATAVAEHTDTAINELLFQTGRTGHKMSPLTAATMSSALRLRDVLHRKNTPTEVNGELASLYSVGDLSMKVGMSLQDGFEVLSALEEAFDMDFLLLDKDGVVGGVQPDQPWQIKDGRFVFDPSKLAGQFQEPHIKEDLLLQTILAHTAVQQIETAAIRAQGATELAESFLSFDDPTGPAQPTEAERNLSEIGGPAVPVRAARPFPTPRPTPRSASSTFAEGFLNFEEGRPPKKSTRRESPTERRARRRSQVQEFESGVRESLLGAREAAAEFGTETRERTRQNTAKQTEITTRRFNRTGSILGKAVGKQAVNFRTRALNARKTLDRVLDNVEELFPDLPERGPTKTSRDVLVARLGEERVSELEFQESLDNYLQDLVDISKELGGKDMTLKELRDELKFAESVGLTEEEIRRAVGARTYDGIMAAARLVR